MQTGIFLRGGGVSVDSEIVVSCRTYITETFALMKIQRSKCGGLVSGER